MRRKGRRREGLNEREENEKNIKRKGIEEGVGTGGRKKV